MQLEKIFDLVRKEDVVFWIGSGFSLYAGYPNGKQLANMIHQSLTPIERKEVNENLSLSDLTEQFVRLKLGSRNALISILKSEFGKPPQSQKWHEVLSKIPHIKTIITTNYDRLFELVYKNEIHPIISVKDVAYRDGRVELIKIHGDINYEDDIVITKTDYAEFFHRNKNQNLIWNVVKERISNKCVVFIGYDMEDDNVLNMFKDIGESLGTNRKELFLIAPGLKSHKIQYLAQLGIQYVNFKGEPFIEKLYENIKDQITADFSKGNVSVDTINKFYKNNDLAFDLKSTPSGFNISSVKSLREHSNGEIQLNFKSDKKFLESFSEVVQGKKSGPFLINGNQLEGFKFLLNEVNIVTDNPDNYRLEIKSVPKKEGLATLVFENGSEFEDLDYKLYVSKNLIEIISEFKGCDYKFEAIFNENSFEKNEIKGRVHFSMSRSFANVNDAILACKLGLNLAQGNAVTIYLPGKDGVSLNRRDSNMPTESLETNIEFFECLKKIEKFYSVRFSNLGEYGNDDFDNAFRAVQFIDDGFYIQDWDGELKWELSEKTPLELFLKIQDGGQMVAKSTTSESVKIYDKEIPLGYIVNEFLDVHIANLDDVISKTTSTIIIRSKSKKVKMRYEKK